MRSLTRTAVVLLTSTILLTACSGGDDAELTRLAEDLDAQEQAQIGLRERILELEDGLAAATAPVDDSATRALQDRVEAAEARIDELARQLEQAGVTREDEQAETLAALSSLEAAVSELRAELDRVNTELVKLREDHELLRRRFDNHTH